MTGRVFAAMSIGLVAFVASASLSSCGVTTPCNDDCGPCPPYRCGLNLTLTASDAGKTFRMGVGEWVSLRLSDQNVAAAGSSSDPTVLKMNGNPWNETLNNNPLVVASFQAVGQGSAQVEFGYVTCPAASAGDPCSYQVAIQVVQFPKAKITIDNLFTAGTIHVRVGDVVRINGPAGVPQTSPESIDDPAVVGWAVEPIYLDDGNWMEAAVIALAPGRAHVQAGPCSSGAPICTGPWRLTFVVT